MEILEKLKRAKEVVENPGEAASEAGQAWVDGVIDRAKERFLDWFTHSIDSLALGGMMVGCFLYMLGVKKGGQGTWLIMAVWFTLKVLLWSSGASI